MKKKIIGGLVALAVICGVMLYQVLPAGAAQNVLDHVTVTPPTATVALGGTVQFVAL